MELQELGSSRPLAQRKTTELILRLLAQFGTSSIAELHRRLRSTFRVRLTYQAVRKAAKILAANGVLRQEADGFSLNRVWLLAMRSLVDELLTGSRRVLPAGRVLSELEETGRAVFAPQSLLEADNLWGDILVELCKLQAKTASVTSIGFYAWWMILNFGRETQLFSEIVRSGRHVDMVLLQSNSLNRWAARLYREAGVTISVLGSNKHDDTLAFNVVGEYVIQVKTPEAMTSRIRQFFKSVARIDANSSAKFLKLAHVQCDLQLSVARDPILAQGILSLYRSPLEK